MISLLLTLVLIGVIAYLVCLIPMDDGVRRVIRVVAIILAVLVALQAFGVISGGPTLPHSHIHLP